jgi:nonribosomal peptide synthetase protein VioG
MTALPTASLWTEYNQTRTLYPDTGGIVRWVERAARAHPDRTAVHTTGGDLSYRELMAGAGQVASLLVTSGVPAGSVVAVPATRSTQDYVAILGVLQAGCAFVPLDAEDPPARLRLILDDCAAAAILAGPGDVPRLTAVAPGLPVHLVPVTAGVPGAGAPDPAGWVAPPPYEPERISYVIYTSGTTGRPKGVCIAEKSLVNFVHWFVGAHEVVAHDRLAQTAALTFDPSLQQIFPAWVTGACLVPVPQAQLLDPFAMMRWLSQERISVVDVVTAQWHHWRHVAGQDPKLRELPDLRWVVVGGETAYHHESHAWHATVRSPALLRNVYGPTEATINASACVIDPAVAEGQISIGVPLPNYRLYVTGPDGGLCGLGDVGELLIAGDGIAAGYRSAEATGKAFGELRLPGGGIERVYRTGDLARLLRTPAGALELGFVGRADTQVKIRGYRIELEEVEHAVKRVPGVRDVAVQLRNSAAEQIACFYTGSESLTEDIIRAQLAERLAAYQLPNLFLRMESFPLTPNGKLDRTALATALEQHLSRDDPVGPAPRTDLARQIAETWQEVLGVARVTADDNFFLVGGTSLLAMTAVRQMRSRGLTVLLSDMFDMPTVAALSSHLQGQTSTAPPPVSG